VVRDEDEDRVVHLSRAFDRVEQPADAAIDLVDHRVIAGDGPAGLVIVGAACALRLAQEGKQVVIFDDRDPGSGCSHGNAAQIGTASVVPFASPKALENAWGWMFDPLHPLRMPLRRWPGNARWILRFRKAAQSARSERSTVVLHAMASAIYADLLPMLEASGTKNWLDRKGMLHVFGSEERLEAARPEYELRRRYGIPLRYLDRPALSALEPALGPRANCGVLLENVGLIRDPGALAARFVETAVSLGATLERRRVRDLHPRAGGGVGIVTEEGRTDVQTAVLAAGIGSRSFLRRLGVRVPITAERGYHLQFDDSAHGLKRSMLYLDHRVVYSPLCAGLRMTTGAEFVPHEASPNHAFYRRIFESARGLLNDEPDLDEGRQWVGSRPSTPDFLPIIGRAPRMRDVLLATGHGHQGLTHAAGTARLVLSLVDGTPTDPVLAALSPERTG